MNPSIEASKGVLRNFLVSGGAAVDRREVVAHATLSAFAHHWPSQASPEDLELLKATEVIREKECSRWMIQRRLAIAKLSRVFAPGDRTSS